MKNKTIVEMLPCDLSDDEIRARGQELAKQEQELAAIQEERKAASRGYSKKLKDKGAEITRLSTDITRKKEDRKVKVEIRFDPNKGVKKYVRLDTDKQVREETMTAEERQGKLVDEDEAEEKRAS